jgi:hypothetical protein
MDAPKWGALASIRCLLCTEVPTSIGRGRVKAANEGCAENIFPDHLVRYLAALRALSTDKSPLPTPLMWHLARFLLKEWKVDCAVRFLMARFLFPER